MRLSEALLLLAPPDMTDLTPGQRLKVCHQTYLERARLAHPDQGGTVDDFKQLQAAWAKVKAWLSTPHQCRDCAGKGSIPKAQHGVLAPFWEPCPTCQGTGWVTPVQDP